ncbi:hypothetical protein ElyMa_004729400 [Elysia marginata]|uniref:Uncharacterized protein n=1 Tax=Elysia marginata TaxID=1093978 RepID=A0AAV4IFT2_9GAST|nr:hypothetical protein ElyMa_004729400 [Elysia marginata]
MKTVCEGRLDSRRRKGRPPISLVTNLTTACGLSLHQIVQKSQDGAGWQQKVRSSIATANTAPGDADSQSIPPPSITETCSLKQIRHMNELDEVEKKAPKVLTTSEAETKDYND